MYPFICYLPDARQQCRLHFYDSIYRYQESRKAIRILEYDEGYRQETPEPVAGLEARFTRELRTRAFGRHRSRMEVIEGRVANFGELLTAHADIVGRRFAVEHVKRFIEEHDRGLLLIEAEPGRGKAALLCHLIENEFGHYSPAPVYFFYRRTAGITDPDVCVKSLYASLLDAHGIEEAEDSRRQDSPEAMYNKLVNLLSRSIAPRLAPSGPQLIFVDAFDEAEPTLGGKTAYQRIPENLPAGVYVIATARPVRDRTVLARRSHLERYDLDSPDLLQENLHDGAEYAGRELVASQLPTETLGEIARVARGNFLVLNEMCKRVPNCLNPDEVRSYLAQVATAPDQLGFIYEEFWNRMTQRARLDEQQYLGDVAGLLVAARAPVPADLICRALNLRAPAWDWALRRLTEYLAVTNFDEEGASESVYRIYHKSFADFCCRDGTILVWDAESCEELTILCGHEGEVSSIAYSSDGRRFASGSADKTVRVWDAVSYTDLGAFCGHEGPVNSVACIVPMVYALPAALLTRQFGYSPDGRQIVSGSYDGTLRAWDAETFANAAASRGQGTPLNGVSFSPDYQRIVSTSLSGAVRLWDSESGVELAVLPIHPETFTWSPDGRAVNPSALLVRSDAQKSVDFQAIVSFRNTVAISSIIDAWCFQLTGAGACYPLWSDYFDFYPFTETTDGTGLIAKSVASLELSYNLDNFSGQSAPYLSTADGSTFGIDRLLLDACLKQWHRRFIRRKKESKTRALFRSLEIAAQASRMPAVGTGSPTIHDAGVGIALWVSALEILSHPHPRKGKASLETVLNLLAGADWITPELRTAKYTVTVKKGLTMRVNYIRKLYAELYRARNDFLHGNPVRAGNLFPAKEQSHPLLLHCAPLIYRAAIASFLGIRQPEILPDRVYEDAVRACQMRKHLRP